MASMPSPRMMSRSSKDIGAEPQASWLVSQVML